MTFVSRTAGCATALFLAVLSLPAPCNGQATLSANPTSVSFANDSGFNSGFLTRTISITSTNPSSGVTLGAPTTTGNCSWLTATFSGGATTAATVSLSANPATPIGSYSCTLTYSGGGGSVNISVTFLVVNPPTPNCSGFHYVEVGAFNESECSGIGGLLPYTFAVIGGALPAGCGIANDVLIVDCTPTTAGPYSVTVQVKDSVGGTGTQTITGTIAPGPAFTGPASLPPATVGVPYGPIPILINAISTTSQWSATGLPTGLGITIGGPPTNSNTLSGTPGAGTQGTYSVQITAIDQYQVHTTLTLPLTVQLPPTPITIQTNPPGLLASVDGNAAKTAPQTVSLSQGSHTIAVASPQAGSAGTQYVFTSWSDGGGASHTITVGAVATTYTANFKLQNQLTTGVSPAGGGTATPVSGGFYDAGTAVAINAVANTGYVFSSWTSNVANPTGASTTVTMTGPQTVFANFTVTSPPLIVTTTSLSNGSVGAAYSATLTASGGTAPYGNWLVAAGSLPPGLSLNATTGVIGGPPTSAAGSPYSFSVTVRDNSGTTSPAQSLSIAIAPGVTASPPPHRPTAA